MNEISWDYLKKSIKEQPDLNGKDIVLWGAGQEGSNIDDRVMLNNAYKSICFCDNDCRKWGTKIANIFVKSPDEVKELPSPYVIICTSDQYRKEIESQLEKAKIPYTNLFERVFYLNKKRFYKVYSEMLENEESKNVFLSIILCRISANYELTKKIYSGKKTFLLPEFLEMHTNKKILIDCGAFVGDSVEEFVEDNEGDFQKIYAFEPFQRQFEAMKIRTNRLKLEWALGDNQIELIRKAVTNKSEILEFIVSDVLSGSYVAKNKVDSVKMEAVSLDDFFKDKELNQYVTIKADIEGQELNMLKGAQHIIKNYHPNLIICLYHNPQDYYEIPEYIHSLVPEYKMYVRHHSFTQCETVLYCCI